MSRFLSYCATRGYLASFLCLMLLTAALSVYGAEPIVSEGFDDKVLNSEEFAYGPPTGYILGEVSMGRAPVMIELSDGHGLRMTLEPGEGALGVGG